MAGRLNARVAFTCLSDVGERTLNHLLKYFVINKTLGTTITSIDPNIALSQVIAYFNDPVHNNIIKYLKNQTNLKQDVFFDHLRNLRNSITIDDLDVTSLIIVFGLNIYIFPTSRPEFRRSGMGGLYCRHHSGHTDYCCPQCDKHKSPRVGKPCHSCGRTKEHCENCCICCNKCNSCINCQLRTSYSCVNKEIRDSVDGIRLLRNMVAHTSADEFEKLFNMTFSHKNFPQCREFDHLWTTCKYFIPHIFDYLLTQGFIMRRQFDDVINEIESIRQSSTVQLYARYAQAILNHEFKTKKFEIVFEMGQSTSYWMMLPRFLRSCITEQQTAVDSPLSKSIEIYVKQFFEKYDIVNESIELYDTKRTYMHGDPAPIYEFYIKAQNEQEADMLRNYHDKFSPASVELRKLMFAELSRLVREEMGLDVEFILHRWASGSLIVKVSVDKVDGGRWLKDELDKLTETLQSTISRILFTRLIIQSVQPLLDEHPNCIIYTFIIKLSKSAISSIQPVVDELKKDLSYERIKEMLDAIIKKEEQPLGVKSREKESFGEGSHRYLVKTNSFEIKYIKFPSEISKQQFRSKEQPQIGMRLHPQDAMIVLHLVFKEMTLKDIHKVKLKVKRLNSVPNCYTGYVNLPSVELKEVDESPRTVVVYGNLNHFDEEDSSKNVYKLSRDAEHNKFVLYVEVFFHDGSSSSFTTRSFTVKSPEKLGEKRKSSTSPIASSISSLDPCENKNIDTITSIMDEKMHIDVQDTESPGQKKIRIDDQVSSDCTMREIEETGLTGVLPLCRPNHYKWVSDQNQLIPIEGDTRKTMELEPVALEYLANIKDAIAVISICGPARTGKSYLLSQLQDGVTFELGHTMSPHTTGIWMSKEPIVLPSSDGRKVWLVLMDTEGIGAATALDGAQNEKWDNQIFTLSTLISSLLIYNSQGVPNANDLEKLNVVANLSKSVYAHSGDKEEKTSSLVRFRNCSPDFVWLVRDQLLQPTDKNGQKCDMKKYLLENVLRREDDSDSSSVKTRRNMIRQNIREMFPTFEAYSLPPPSLDPDVVQNMSDSTYASELNKNFLTQLHFVKNQILATVRPKRMFGASFLTGATLLELIKTYVNALNENGFVPEWSSAWENTLKVTAEHALKVAINEYRKCLDHILDKLPCNNDVVLSVHYDSIKKASELFLEETKMTTKSMDEYISRLMRGCAEFDKDTHNCIGGILMEIVSRNFAASEKFCEELFSKLQQEHIDPILEDLTAETSFNVLLTAVEFVYKEYEARAIGPSKGLVLNRYARAFNRRLKEAEKDVAKMKDYDDRLKNEMEKCVEIRAEIDLVAQQNEVLSGNLKMEEKQNNQVLKMIEEQQKRAEKDMDALKSSFDKDKENLLEIMKSTQESQSSSIKEMMDAQDRQIMEFSVLYEKEKRALSEEQNRIQRTQIEQQAKLKILESQTMKRSDESFACNIL